MLKFDKETARLLETAYLGADLTRRRQASFDAVAPLPGEAILDIGSGNGLLAVEMARAVGPQGQIIGVDPSADMHASAAERCRTYDQIALREGDAYALPLADHTVDKVVSVQVFEYLDNIPAALAEAARVLKPGGRLVIADTHFDTIVWHSDDPARMRAVQRSWDSHFTEARVPALLPTLMQTAGLRVQSVVPHTTVDTVLRPDGLANMLLILMARYAVDSQQIAPEIVQQWRDEQFTMAAAGRFFFALTQFVTIAQKI